MANASFEAKSNFCDKLQACPYLVQKVAPLTLSSDTSSIYRKEKVGSRMEPWATSALIAILDTSHPELHLLKPSIKLINEQIRLNTWSNNS